MIRSRCLQPLYTTYVTIVNLFTNLFFERTIKSVPTIEWGIMQRHHLYWPRKKFRKSSTHWKFRQLPCNIVMVTAEEHRAIHAQRRESEMPTREQMLQKLDLCKDCKGNCVSHSQRIDHILGLIDEALGE